MKAEFDKEIDSLLRRESARRGRAASAAPSTPHLDADEQSAYAENALPAAARAHYTAHLADCDDCRHGVTQLALAAGMPAQLEPRETATGQAVSTNVGWRERLGALFAPRSLRYVAPALALLLVGAVSLIVLTRKPSLDGASVAQHNTAETQRAAQPPQTEAHHAPRNNEVAADAATPAAGSAPVAPNQNAPQSKEEIAANDPRGVSEQPLVVAPLNDAAPPPPAPSSAAGASARSVSELQRPEATPAPVSDAVTVTADQQGAKINSGESVNDLRKLEQRTGNFENRQYENRQRESISGPHRNINEQARNARTSNAENSLERADKKDGNLGATTAPASPSAAMRRSTRREADRGGADERAAADAESSERARKSSAETRTVGGRKFRRQGDAWVDTAYQAGQSYTVVRRNSEQFRALVADEPGLRRIAGALGGDVTVVWKGRAYRFR